MARRTAAPSLAAALAEQHPQLEVTWTEGYSDGLLDALTERRLDAVLTFPQPGRRFEQTVWAEEPAVLEVCRDHPQAGHGSVGAGELTKHEIASNPLRSIIDLMET